MWEPAFADFSSAAPWLGVGFIAGLLFYAIARAALGVDSRSRAALADAESRLADVQGAASALSVETNRLAAQLAKTSARAALADRLETEFAQSQNRNSQLQSQCDEAAKQFAVVRDENEAQRSATQYYQDEYGRLAAKHDEAVSSAYAELSEMAKHAAGLNAHIVAENAAHAGEIAELKANIAAAAQGIDPELYESEVATLLDTIKDLRMVLAAAAQNGFAAAPPQGIDPELYESEVEALLGTVKDLRVELAASEGAMNRVRAALGH